MHHYAILVDGGFVRRKLGTRTKPAGLEDLRQLPLRIGRHPALAGMWLHRTYYYDAQPLTQSVDRPLNGGRVDFGQSELAIRSRQLFQDLAKEPFTALRIGELSFEGWRVSPRRLEKAVGDAVQIHAADLEPPRRA
jgi:hypothetical protein